MEYICDGYTIEYSEKEGKIFIDKCIEQYTKRIVIPSKINNKPVYRINDLEIKPKFLMCSVEDFVIEEGVNEIGNLSFTFCNNLKSIHFSASIKKIDGLDFRNCRELSVIEVDENNNFFSSCNGSNLLVEKQTNTLICGISSSKLAGNNIKIIKSHAFRGLDNLEQLEIPNGCVVLEENSIENCINLKTLIIPSTIEKASNALKNCNTLLKVVMPNNNHIKYDEISKNFIPIYIESTKLPLCSFLLHVESNDKTSNEFLDLSYNKNNDYIMISSGVFRTTGPEIMKSFLFQAKDIFKEALSDLCFLLGYTKENLNTNTEEHNWQNNNSKIVFSIKCENYTNNSIVILDDELYIKIVSILEYISPYRIDFIANTPKIKYSIDNINLKYITIPDVYQDMYSMYELLNNGKRHPCDLDKILIKKTDFSNRNNLQYVKFRRGDFNLEDELFVNCTEIKKIVLEDDSYIDKLSLDTRRYVCKIDKILDAMSLDEGDII